MTDIVPLNKIAKMSTADLRDELAKGLALTCEVLLRLAAVWAELERRGEDLSDLKRGLGRTLPLIASGRLAAEVVVAFAGKPSVLRALEGVPLDQQRRLADGGTIPVWLPSESESPTELPVGSIPGSLLRTVFGDGEIRSPAEQRLRLRSARSRTKETKSKRQYRVQFDSTASTVTVGKMTVPLKEVLAAIGESFSPDRVLAHDLAPSEYATATAKLHPSEKEALKRMVKHSGIEEPALVRLALRACGLLADSEDLTES